MSFSRYEAMDMDVMYKGTCTSTSHRMDSWVNNAPSAQGPMLSATIAADRRGAPKLRTQMPPTIDAADRHASVAAIQSPLSRLMKVP